ncbi:MAG: hypothetical protein PVG32_08160 [Anaerolineales bacterium]
MKQIEFDRAIDNPLGTLQATFHDRPLQWRDLILTFIPGCLAVLAPLFYGLSRWYQGTTKFGQVAAIQWSKPWIVLATFALIALLLLAILRIRKSHRYINIYKNGIRLRLGFRKNHTITWGQIKGINTRSVQDKFLSKPLKTHQQITLHLVNNHKIRIDDEFNNFPEIATRLKAKIYPRQLLKSREIYHTNQLITFGPLTLSQKYIYVDNRKIPLESINFIGIRSGHLILSTKNNHQERISVSEIPNIEILLQLLRESMNG